MNPKSIIAHFPKIALIVLAAIMLLPGLDSLPLIDRDEPRFAHATVEMMYRNEWVVPYFNDEYRFDKPPLTYWWMRVHFWMFGINEFSARLHSALGSLFCALLVFGFARRLGCDNLRAFLAGAGWLTCLQVLVHSRMAVADMPLILFIILTMWAVWELMHRPPAPLPRHPLTNPWFWILWISVGLGFLAKGPLSIAIPFLALILSEWAIPKERPRFAWSRCGLYLAAVLVPFLLFDQILKPVLVERFPIVPFKALGVSCGFWLFLILFCRADQRRRALFPLLGLPLAYGLIAAWGIPALIATEGEFFNVGIGRHVVERGTSAFNERFFIPGIYYLIVIIPFLLPWSSRLPEALKTAWRGDDQKGRFLLGWFLSPFLIFSFYATQLPHYILPGYPAFFLLLFLSGPERPAGKFARALGTLCVALPVGGLLFFLLCALLIPEGAAITGLRPLLILAVVGVAFIAAATWLALRRKDLAVVLVSVLGAILIVPISKVARDLHVTLRLRDALADRHFDYRISWKFNEPSLVWYFDDRAQFRWERWGANWQRPDHDNIIMVLEHRRWRIDGKTVGAIIRRQDDIPPTKARRETDDFRKAVATLKQSGQWQEVKVIGWSPATTSWIELVALVPEGDGDR